MVKRIGIALLCASLGSTLYAGDNISESRPFIGLELGYSTVQGDVGGFYPGDIIKDYEGSDIEYGIRLGAQKEEWRTTISFNYFDGDEDGIKQNYEKVLASIDYFFLNSEDSKFKPFLGANVGYLNYESTSDIDMSGLVYGAQAGVVFSITDSIDMDLQYRYSLSNATQEDHDASLDHIGGVVFGVNYIY